MTEEKKNKPNDILNGSPVSIDQEDPLKTKENSFSSNDDQEELLYANFRSLEITEIRPYFDSQDLVLMEEHSPGVIKEWMAQMRENAQSENVLKKRYSIGDIWLEAAGLILGFLLAIAFLYAAYQLTIKGHDVAGIILGTIDIVALVSVFVIGKKQNSKKPGKDNSSSPEEEE